MANKVKKILISQPEPKTENSPYHALQEKYKVAVDFKQFIKVESVPFKEFRKSKIEILAHTAIILTSRNAVDNLFRVMAESKQEMPPDMKYFCVTEQTANYLQKYITIRKRKIFTGKKTAQDLFDVLLKHKDEIFLYPCSNIRKDDIPNFLTKNEIEFNEAILYKTVANDISDVSIHDYDIIAFFSPSGVSSLFSNFPEFDQNGTKIAAFGPTTAKAVEDYGLKLAIQAPMPNAPSMTGAIELYIKETE